MQRFKYRGNRNVELLCALAVDIYIQLRRGNSKRGEGVENRGGLARALGDNLGVLFYIANAAADPVLNLDPKVAADTDASDCRRRKNESARIWQAVGKLPGKNFHHVVYVVPLGHTLNLGLHSYKQRSRIRCARARGAVKANYALEFVDARNRP